MPLLTAITDIRKSLVWAAPLDPLGDFTPEDPLALDYVGQQVGLVLFGALTTRTSRAQNFAVVLYGLALADEVLREQVNRDDEVRQRLFERWERLWALSVLEFHQGDLPRGSPDSMRGVQGARRAWTAGGHPLPLDYRLISRQGELGSLGAYLSSLRELGLVFRGSLRVTPAGDEIVKCFWGEAGHRRTAWLHRYALLAMDEGRTTVPRQEGNVSLALMGELSRLQCLVEGARSEQQRRLHDAIICGAKDDTERLSELVEAVCRAGTTEPRAMVQAMLRGRPVRPEPDLIPKLELALAFMDAAAAIRTMFDAVYSAVEAAGWSCDINAVLNTAMHGPVVEHVRQTCERLVRVERFSLFGAKMLHGSGFQRLVSLLAAGDPKADLAHLLAFHGHVQRERGRGTGWIGADGDRLVADLTSYTGHRTAARAPSLKFDVVRRLLVDVGRLPPGGADED